MRNSIPRTCVSGSSATSMSLQSRTVFRRGLQSSWKLKRGRSIVESGLLTHGIAGICMMRLLMRFQQGALCSKLNSQYVVARYPMETCPLSIPCRSSSIASVELCRRHRQKHEESPKDRGCRAEGISIHVRKPVTELERSTTDIGDKVCSRYILSCGSDRRKKMKGGCRKFCKGMHDETCYLQQVHVLNGYLPLTTHKCRGKDMIRPSSGSGEHIAAIENDGMGYSMKASTNKS